MIRGIYCSNTGLNAIQKKMEVIANNIANINTDGFKQQKISIKTFKKEMDGVMADIVQADFSKGNITTTASKYNFAVNGDAYFTLNTSQGYRYTANGSFVSDAAGYLIDNKGNRVVGVSGEVKIIDGKPDQEFYLATFSNKEFLSPTEFGLNDTGLSGMSKAENIEVIQNVIENSNTDLLDNIADMISTARSFSVNSRMITSHDDMLKKATEEIGSLK